MKKEDKKIWLYALILVVIVLLILLRIFKNNANKDNLWYDYDEFSYANAFLKATRVEDRTIYWALDDIVSQFVDSYMSSGKTYGDVDESTITYEDYYYALYEGYQNHLGKDGYMELAKAFLEKFMIENEMEFASMESNGLIDSVYMIQENVYMCDLTSKIKQTSAYIVIKLDPQDTSFEIMYME